ncbi:AAA family ATPase [Yersinia kristensenii]|uniref:AAA family ATPase n=1 Tax=Yersinia kristensenii TaxID=28152 RepID=UPI0005E011BE|nr:AAA family ATPase [Yersinia kristensenii]CNG63083.1 hemin importer ATP-binding subunit [Yersinia kristensenii]CNK69152.1 hemin importer ATP-binding subunit [Yersinia kristensenii]
MSLIPNFKLDQDQIIKCINVEKLYGSYDYCLPESGALSNTAILYGDNGVGKSTVLRLVFHLLSPSNTNGHRKELYDSIFEKLTVVLTSGVSLTAKFEMKRGKKILNLAIFKNNESLAEWDFSSHKRSDLYDGEDEDILIFHSKKEMVEWENFRTEETTELRKSSKGKWGYLRVLKKVVPKTFILNADRRLDSDSVSDPSDEIELRRKMKFNEPKSINGLVARSREIALSQALNTANKWISRKAVEGTNLGAENVHSVYIKVLRQLALTGPKLEIDIPSVDKEELLEKLIKIENKTIELAQYELATALDTHEFQEIINNKTASYYHIAVDLLKPYIESLESRLEAVDPIYLVLNKFITIINSMLTDKKIGYHLSRGFYIKSSSGEDLESSHLSSGEQQLLLLFCYVLVARDEASVFMIDEPEISLNIKWQRKLIQSLLDITSGADIQFIFASHSMELLSMHLDKVVRLENRNV